MIRVPFTLPDDGLREVKGLVFVEEGKLIIRVESKLLGLVDKKEKEIEIEAGALEDIFVKRRLFKDRLVIRPLGSELLDAVPGDHADQLELKVSRKLRRNVEQLIDSFWL